MVPTDDTPPTPGPGGAEGAAERRPAPASRARTFAKLATLPTFFLVGLSAGLFLQPPPPAPPAATPDLAKEPWEKAAGPTTDLAAADRKLRAGDIDTALAAYRLLVAETREGNGPIQFRIGLCHETVGDAKAAAVAYRVAAGPATPAPLRAAAQVGLARCLIRLGRAAEAKHLLYPHYFAGGADHEARHLLALALSHAAFPPTEADAAGKASRGHVPPGPGPATLAALSSEARNRPDAKPPEEPLVLEESPEGTHVIARAVLPELPASEVMAQVARLAGLELRWEGEAEPKAHERVVRLSLQQVAAAHLLRSLADSQGLVCEIDGNRASVSDARPPAANRAFHSALARGAITDAVSAVARDRLSPAIHLEAGAQEFAAGDVAKAEAIYTHLLEEFPTAPEAHAAHFSLAVLRDRAGNVAAARKAYFRAIDLAPEHELAVAAYVEIARMVLEEGNLSQAISYLGRAEALGGESRGARAVLLTAAAHLMGGDPGRCRATLAVSRPRLTGPGVAETVTFLESLSAWRLAPSREAARREAPALLTTLLPGRHAPALGGLGDCLVGEAMEDLGLWTEAARHYAAIHSRLRGPLAERAAYAHGQALLRAGRVEEAAERLRTVAEFSRHGPAAQFALAEIDLTHGRAAECAERCRKLWAKLPEPERPTLLRLWGAAYEGMGELERAAACYAGRPNGGTP